MADLTTLAKVKDYLNKTDTGDDTYLGTLITRASAFTGSFCGRVFSSTSYDEKYDGEGIDRLLLNQFPVTQVTNLWISDNLQGTDTYIVYRPLGLIRRKSSDFPTGKQNVRVQYTAGYTTIPTDLEEAVIKLAAWSFHGRSGYALGVSSSSSEQGSTSVVQELPWDIKEVLLGYKRYAL